MTTPPTYPFTPTAFCRRARTGRRMRAAMRPRSYSICSAKRSRARRDRGTATATEVRREEAPSSTQRCGGRRHDAGRVLPRGDTVGVRRRLRIGGGFEDNDEKKHAEVADDAHADDSHTPVVHTADPPLAGGH